MKNKIILLASLFIFNIYSKVLIITHSYNRHDFIEIQDKTFKKFLKDDYEFVVFNDAPDPDGEFAINLMCQMLNIRCIRIPQNIHTKPYLYRFPGEHYPNANTRCADVVQYSLDELGFKHNGLVMIIDSDMFLIKQFSIEEFMKNTSLAGVSQSRGHVSYLWNGLVFFNMNNLPNKREMNFNCGIVEGQPTDVGGYLHYYFKQYPNIACKYINVLHSDAVKCDSCRISNAELCQHNTSKLEELKFDPICIKFFQNANNIEFLIDNHFVHYRGGGNWDHKSSYYHQMKTQALNNFLKDLLN